MKTIEIKNYAIQEIINDLEDLKELETYEVINLLLSWENKLKNTADYLIEINKKQNK